MFVLPSPRLIKMRILFVLRKASINHAGQAPLNCRVTINGIKANDFSTRLSTSPDKWDSKKQRVIGKSDATYQFNQRLDEIRVRLSEIYSEGKSRGVSLSAEEVKDIFSGKKEITIAYVKLSKQYLEELKMKNRSLGTIRAYRRAFTYLNQYLGKNVNIDLIEKRHVSGFWRWLKSKGYKSDYCNKLLQNCVGLFRYGIREGVVSRNPFEGIALEWNKDLDTTFLDEMEVESIRNTELAPRLRRVADSFLFMCYTGLHIGDYLDITEELRYKSEGMEFMKIKRVKTGVTAIFPLTPGAIEIIDKYGGVDKLPKISSQKSNDYLKLIAEKVDITKNLTNKIARKTFTDKCMNHYGLSDEVVAAMLGHTTTRQIRHYGKIREKRIAMEWRDKAELA
jgi:site-specific recombinase XerD